jgi:hypothetical protein
MRTLTKTLILGLSLGLVDCGGGDDPATPDANTNNADANNASCLVNADLASPTLAEQVGSYAGTPATPDFVDVIGTVNADAMPDGFAVELYAGSGALAGGIVPGTYPLAGADLNYETCGVCVRLFTDFNGTQFTDAGYFATGGTVTITQVSPNFIGSVSNITMEHVEVDATTFASTPHADGCTTSVTAASWDVVPELLQ